MNVGIPAHARPVFLADAIESVLTQDHKELRVVVLDDSENDEIEAVVGRWADDTRLEYRRTEPTSAMHAMTELIGAGNAPYFAFLHDDDRWAPGFLARRVEFLERNRECAFVFSGHVDIDADGRVIGQTPAPFPEGVVPQAVLVPELLQHSVVGVMHSVLCRRSALQRAGPWLDESVPRLFDWELWLRVALAGPAGCLATQDAEYRAHTDQMSSNPGRGRDFAVLYQHGDRLVAERAPELALDPRRRARRDARVALSVAIDMLQADDPRGARRAVRSSLAADLPTALKDRRLAGILLGLALGRPGRAAFGRARSALYRHRHRQRLRGARDIRGDP